MAEWFANILHSLLGQSGPPVSVRQALIAAHKARTKISLETMTGDKTVVVTTAIVQVDERDFVVSQPTIGILTHPLAFGETLRMSFVHELDNYVGETRCLGRVKIPATSPTPVDAGSETSNSHSGDPQVLHAYSLAIPSSMQRADRRLHSRVRFDRNAPESMIYAASMQPLMGRLADLSMSGARMVLTGAQPNLTVGQQVYLKAFLAEPVGTLDELVQIVRTDFARGVGQQSVIMQFRRQVPGLAELLDRLLAPQRRKAG